MESRCTIGAMASKKASSVSPVRPWMAADSAGEVSGPVATMTLSQSGGGRPATSPRSMETSGCASSCRVTCAEKPSRSTASAPPAGSLWASPAAMISEPARRISSCSRPTALVSASSERKLLEQTCSARPSVLCASVMRLGRISCSTTGTPAGAPCQAASLPASPPPMMWMGRGIGQTRRNPRPAQRAAHPQSRRRLDRPEWSLSNEAVLLDLDLRRLDQLGHLLGVCFTKGHDFRDALDHGRGACEAELLFHLRRLGVLHDLAIEPLHDLLRRSRRRPQAEPDRHVGIGIAELGQGGDVRKVRTALGVIDVEQVELARLHMRQRHWLVHHLDVVG